LALIFDSEGYLFDPHELNDDGEYTESALSTRARLSKAGFDVDRVVVISGNRVGTLFKDVGLISSDLESDPFCISTIVVDSWGAIQSEQAVDKIESNSGKDISDVGKSYGGNAKTIGSLVQYFLDIAIQRNVTMFWVQHCIQNLDTNTNIKWILVGGQKLQFLVHSVLFLEGAASKDSHLLDGETVSEKHADAVFQVGKKIYAKCDKSRFIPEGRKVEFFMNFSTMQFAMPEYSLANLAINLKLFDLKGAWYRYPKDVENPYTFQGVKSIIEALKNNRDFYNQLMQECFDSTYTDAVKGVKIGSDLGIEGQT
jgi:hypothetical protein